MARAAPVDNTAYLNSRSTVLDYGQIFAVASLDIRLLNNVLFAPGERDTFTLTGWDFRVGVTSPGVDTGRDVSALVGDDVVGTIRPQGGGFDRGAYEQ